MPPHWRCCWNSLYEELRKSRSNVRGKKGEPNARIKVCEPVYVAFIAKSLHNDGKHLRFGISGATSNSYFIIYYYRRVVLCG